MSAARFLELVVRLTPDAADEAAYVLADLGVPGSWHGLDGGAGDGLVDVHAYLPEELDADAIVARLAKALGLAGTLDASLAPLEDRPWGELWEEFFVPTRVAVGVWVARPGARVPAEPGEVVIRIEPGCAFGTGLHATTRLCLRRVTRIVGARGPERLARERLLDVGTGSGILAIAALRKGLGSAVGIDLDVASIEEAAENARRNRVAGRLTLASHGPEAVEGRFDIVVANLTVTPLCELAAVLVERAEPAGRLVVSGIVREEEATVRAAFAELGWQTDRPLRDGEWSSFGLRPVARP